MSRQTSPKIQRIEAKDLRAFREPRERGGQVVRRSGANVTQILRNDQIGREFLQSLGVDGIKAFTA